jgi:N-acetylmuramoyl-L-alanine amidase
VRDRVVEVVARTIYGEARGLPVLDRLAVGLVIYERVRRPGWWGTDFVSVCQKPRQFSCWNEGDPNLPKMLTAESSDPVVWRAVVNVAEFVVYHVRDRDLRQVWATNEVDRFPTHYHRRELSPSWSRDAEVIPTLWDSVHLFVAGVGGSPRRRSE